MANPFFVQPADYTGAIGTLGRGLQQYGEAQQLQKQQQEQQRQIAGLQDAVSTGDLSRVADYMIANPNMSQNVQRNIFGAMQIKDDIQKQQLKEDTFKMLSDPKSIEQILNERISKIKERGGDPSHTVQELQTFKQDPKQFLQGLEGIAASSFSPEYKQWSAAMKGQTQKPMTAYEQATIESKRIDQELRRSEIENKKLENQLKRETDDLKRQELQQKIDANQQKIDKAQADKEQGAIDAYYSGLDTLKLIRDIETHPGFSDYVGAKGASSLFGLKGEPIPGSDAASVAGMIETLSSQNFMNSIQQMKGMGALSDAEGRKVASAVSSLDPNMSEAQFKRSLDTIKSITRRGMDKAKRIMEKRGVSLDRQDNQQFPGAPSIGTVDSGYEYIGGDPSNPESWRAK